jgi:hypothetical protein
LPITSAFFQRIAPETLSAIWWEISLRESSNSRRKSASILRLTRKVMVTMPMMLTAVTAAAILRERENAA